jgi:hypothetical protein
MLGRLLTAALGHVDFIRVAPFPQRSLGRLRFECVPRLKTVFRCEQLLETRISAAAPEAGLHVRVPVRQPLFNKPEREGVPEVKLIFVRDRDVPIGCF